MDIHTVDSDTFSVEDVVKAHMEDLAVQEKFGVTQLKYWVNEEAKTLFCLMKGPNKEACHQVHKQSHGNTACNIIEVSDNEYNLFMGVGKDVNDLAYTPSGDLDTGYRTLLLMNLVSFSGNQDLIIEKIHKLLKQHNGALIHEPNNNILISFVFASEAISFVNSMKTLLDVPGHKIEYSMGMASGRPVDEQGDTMFEETKKKVNALCALGLSKKVYLDEASHRLLTKEFPTSTLSKNSFTIVKNEELALALELAVIFGSKLTQSKFNSERLTAALSFSKSQAYRKIKSLTGFAPNQLIQEFRFQKTLDPLKEGEKTVAEIAYESGFNSPTYFTRAFRKRFGISPTEFAAQLV
jgi:AraC-like DNA-binding protein